MRSWRTSRLRIALIQPYALYRGEQAQHSTPSIGVTLFRRNELAVDILLKQADMALYQAKGAGRNTIRFFNPAMPRRKSALRLTSYSRAKVLEVRFVVSLIL